MSWTKQEKEELVASIVVAVLFWLAYVIAGLATAATCTQPGPSDSNEPTESHCSEKDSA